MTRSRPGEIVAPELDDLHAETRTIHAADIEIFVDLHVHARYEALPEPAILPFPPLARPGWFRAGWFVLRRW
jgi:hypothetical protein